MSVTTEAATRQATTAAQPALEFDAPKSRTHYHVAEVDADGKPGALTPGKWTNPKTAKGIRDSRNAVAHNRHAYRTAYKDAHEPQRRYVVTPCASSHSR